MFIKPTQLLAYMVVNIGDHFKIGSFGLPWWASGKESICQCRGHGFYAWLGKIPHTSEQLNLCAPTTEAFTPLSLCSVIRKATATRSSTPQLESCPRCPQIEKARLRQQRLHVTKNK